MEIGSTNASTYSSPYTLTGARPQKVEHVNHGSKTEHVVSSIELLHKDKSELSVADEVVVKAIEKANKAINGVGKRFEYSVHRKTGEVMVKVINQETNETIREIPSEKLLDLVAKLQEICGIIIDEKR